VTHKIIENNREIYIIFEGIVDSNDFCDHHILECFDTNKNVTLELKNITSNTCIDGLAGLYIIAKDLNNVTLKGFSKEFEKTIDDLLKM